MIRALPIPEAFVPQAVALQLRGFTLRLEMLDSARYFGVVHAPERLGRTLVMRVGSTPEAALNAALSAFERGR